MSNPFSELVDPPSVLASMHPVLGLIILGGLLFCGMQDATAAVAHKWVDADGQIHYSDTPPETIPTTQIELETYSDEASGERDDYYSIQNQWQRLLRERLERERQRASIANTAPAPVDPAPIIIEVESPRSRGHSHRPYHYRDHHRGHRDAHDYRKAPVNYSRPGKWGSAGNTKFGVGGNPLLQ